MRDERKQRLRPPALPGLVAALLLALAACSSEPEQEEPAPEPEAPPVQEATAQPGEQERPQEGPATPQEMSPQELFEQERRARTLAQQRNDILVREYLMIAGRLMADMRLEEAERTLLKALELRPGDEEVLARLNQVLAMQGEPVQDVEELGKVITRKRQLVRQQRYNRVRDLWVKANQEYEQGEYEDARELLEQASLIMRFDEFQSDFRELEQEVPAMLEMVESRLEQSRRAQEEQEFREAYEQLLEEEEVRKKREREEVTRLMTAALESFQNQDFENAEHLARKVLRKYPGYLKAKELVEVSRQARRATWRARHFEVRRDRYQTWLEEIRETQVPYGELLMWPDRETWEQKTRIRRRQIAMATQTVESEEVRAIKARLENERITWEFGETETTLNEAIRQIRSTQGFNILLDPEVKAEKGEDLVNVTLVNHNLGSALRTMLEYHDLAYTFKNEVLYITYKDRALGTPIPRVYEVRDLTISLPNFKAPDLNLRPGGAGEAAKTAIWGEEGEKTQDTTIDQLLDLVRDNVGAGTWENPGFSLEASGGRIVATTTPSIHLQLQRFLDDLRRFTKLSVHVESRFISINKASLDAIGVDFRGLGGSNPGVVATLDDVSNGPPDNASAGFDNGSPGLPAAASLSPHAGAFFNDNSDGDVRARTEHLFDRTLGTLLGERGGAAVAFTLLDDLQVTALLRAVEKSLDATMVTAPRLTIYNNQRANLTLVNQVSYVKDYDVEVAQTAFIADPLVDVVQDGLTLDVRPTISYDRKYVTLEVQPTVATLTRPIRTFETNLSGLTTPVVIELPELEVKSAATTVRVPDGGFLVIGGFKQISTVDRRSETPVLSNIPLLSFFFSKKGRSDEIRDLLIVLNVRIVDLSEQESQLVN